MMVKVGFLGLGLKTVSRAHRGSSENTGVYHHGHKHKGPHHFHAKVQTGVIYDIVVFMVGKKENTVTVHSLDTNTIARIKQVKRSLKTHLATVTSLAEQVQAHGRTADFLALHDELAQMAEAFKIGGFNE